MLVALLALCFVATASSLTDASINSTSNQPITASAPFTWAAPISGDLSTTWLQRLPPAVPICYTDSCELAAFDASLGFTSSVFTAREIHIAFTGYMQWMNPCNTTCQYGVAPWNITLSDDSVGLEVAGLDRKSVV